MAFKDPLTIAGVTLDSRLLLGTAGYPSPALLSEAIEASGSQLLTLGLKRTVQRGDNGFVELALQTARARGAHLLPEPPTEAMAASTIDRPTNAVARIVVARVMKSAAPRADNRPAGLPPTPSPPPSDFCIRMTPIIAAATTAWTTSRKVKRFDIISS
eukprot:gene9465-12013_t